MKVKNESEDTHSYLTVSDPMDCSLPGSSVHGVFQARVLEWGVIAREMQIEIIMRYHYTSTRKAKIKKADSTKY